MCESHNSSSVLTTTDKLSVEGRSMLTLFLVVCAEFTQSSSKLTPDAQGFAMISIWGEYIASLEWASAHMINAL